MSYCVERVYKTLEVISRMVTFEVHVEQKAEHSTKSHYYSGSAMFTCAYFIRIVRTCNTVPLFSAIEFESLMYRH